MVEGTSKHSENKCTYLDVHINFFNWNIFKMTNYAIPFNLMTCIADPICDADCLDVSHCAHCLLNT